MSWPLFAVLLWLVYLSHRERRLFVRLRRALRDDDNYLGDDAPGCDEQTFVSIVIPTRNEERTIAACVRAALAQDHPFYEVVVIDDGSTDRTAAILAGIQDPRLRVIRGSDAPLPAGWLGKPWACHRAIQAARGRWLLFTDADVELGPRAVSVAVGCAERRQLGFLSGFGTELTVGLAEKILHAYVFFGSAMGTDWEAVNDPACRSKARGNGRFFVTRREVFERLGGFESVRDVVVEDEALGRRAKQHGVGYRFCFIPTLYRCRMYRSAREVWAGWRRSVFYSPAIRLPGQNLPLWRVIVKLILAAVLLLAFGVSPYVIAALALAGALPLWMAGVAAVPIVLRLTSRLCFDRRVGFDALTGLVTHWLANLLMVVLFADAARTGLRRSIRWKDRTLPQ